MTTRPLRETHRGTIVRRSGPIAPFLSLGVIVLSQDAWISPARAAPRGAGETMTLAGVVRDFHASHGDFNITLSTGNGHYAGNIDAGLNASGRPTFIGGGFKVANQWRDSAAREIAPHMYSRAFGEAGTIYVRNATVGPKHGIVDTYNSAIGPYGGANVGPAPTYVIGATMPPIAVPASLSSLPNQGTLTYSGTNTITSNIRCNTLNASGTLNISGNIAILCEQGFHLDTHTVINLGADSRLTLYMRNGGSSWNHVEINKNTGDPQRVIVYNLGSSLFMIHNLAEVYATIVSPNATLELANHGEMFGQFAGKQIEYDNHAGFHVDGALRLDLCGVTLNDTAGMRGAASNGGIGSVSNLMQWYTDTLGVNLSRQHNIVLTRDSNNVWEHHSDAFFPIDGQLFGNEGMTHNFFFTYAITTTFTHHACGDRFFEFRGADDAWLFIDGQLVLDLGGLMPNQLQRIDVDRLLSLHDGATYRIDLFYAQRNPTTASFHLRTNLDLTPDVAHYSPSAGVD